MKKTLCVGLYGANGHQIYRQALSDRVTVLSAAKVPEEQIAKLEAAKKAKIRRCETLEEMLADPALDLVSVCSPKRSEQYEDLKKILKAGKHAYAEKPAVFTEEELDELLALAKEKGAELHEYSDTVYAEPFWSLAKAVRSGRIGKPVQVFVQKSYPYNAGKRNPDDDYDGGIIRWVGIHAVKFAEQTAGIPVERVSAVKSRIENAPGIEELYNNASLLFTMRGGATGSAVINYFKPAGFPLWGNETVRIFGTAGFAEVTDGGQHSHIYTDRDEGELAPDPDLRDYFDLVLDHFLGGAPFPLSEEEEFHPLRVVIRAEQDALKKI